MDAQPINNLISEYRELYGFLNKNHQIALAISISNHYKKILLLSCASLYEKYFTENLMEIIKNKTNHESLSTLFYNKSIKQQYFKFFDWKEDRGNIKGFLSLFGNEVQKNIQAEIDIDSELQEGMNSFLKIGYNRNLLVHENFIVYNLEKTFEEIEYLHGKAIKFLVFLMDAINRYI
ncbi:MAG: hypothetical protein HFJ22_07365 [Clostridia bacterium]|jgi:hypothetical protein|nr:hypothetical protein [Clostridia bacterium]